MLLPYEAKLRQLNIILASQSQGRKQLLENMKLFEFTVFPSNFAEDLDKKNMEPLEYVKKTCLGKVNEVIPRLQNENIPWDIVFFADTICELDGKIIEKPESQQEAIDFLNFFNNKWHNVHTCVYVFGRRKDGQIKEINFIETTQLLFAKMSQPAIYHYSLNEELWRGRAGGYAIQGRGISMAQQIKGLHQIYDHFLVAIRILQDCHFIDYLKHLQRSQNIQGIKYRIMDELGSYSNFNFRY